MRLYAALVTAALTTSAYAADPVATYTPQPVYCADSTQKTLCNVLPSFLGPDPAIVGKGVGYEGLSNNVTSFEEDVQSPFDNMAWQMFVALNWQASGGSDPKSGLSGTGPAIWQTWSHPEDVFGGAVASCDNPNNLPRFDLIAKADAQSDDEEFLQATKQPLIDVNGNWTLFERRLNDVEKNYILSNGLDSLAGQQVFASGGNTVSLPIGDMTKANGAPGAIEVKAAWRIISDSEKASYFSQRALLDVEGAYVSDGKPLCQEVTLGLVGLHLIQNNGKFGNLLPQFIWASFEHQSNAPTAENACDATDPNYCYKQLGNNVCPAKSGESGTYSFWNAACTAAGPNVPPQLKSGQKDYVWQRTAPYAGNYTTQQGNAQCGTQATHCWQVYGLTQQLNTAWRAQLQTLGSVFQNYYLIGTNWGGKVEPDGTTLANGSVPSFMGNITMETYIQTDPQFGNCVGCHTGAALAYKGPDPKHPKTYTADFSFLLKLATKTCTDVNAGPIWNNGQAATTCPKTCTGVQLQWNGQWTTTEPGVMSVCGCCLPPATGG
jgi:hypothetical protein